MSNGKTIQAIGLVLMGINIFFTDMGWWVLLYVAAVVTYGAGCCMEGLDRGFNAGVKSVQDRAVAVIEEAYRMVQELKEHIK